MLLEGDENKLSFTGLGELCFHWRTSPIESEEGFLYFRLKIRVQVVYRAISSRWETVRLIDDLIVVFFDHTTCHHTVGNRIGDSSGIIVAVNHTQNRVVVCAGKRRVI